MPLFNVINIGQGRGRIAKRGVSNFIMKIKTGGYKMRSQVLKIHGAR